jgi:cytochrome c oxidase cbb3-type subunit 4
MDMYSLMREFADSWMLLFLVLFFLGVVFWVFRPGSTKEQRDSANIIFRHEDSPSEDRAELDPKEVRE